MSTILDEIVASKRREILESRKRLPEHELRAAVSAMPAPRDFLGTLAAAGPIRLIAEIKRASPSAGIIRSDFDPDLRLFPAREISEHRAWHGHWGRYPDFVHHHSKRCIQVFGHRSISCVIMNRTWGKRFVFI